jgi:dihydroorotase
MPNTDPVADNDSVIRFIMEKAVEKAAVKVYPIGSITRGSAGVQLAEMGMMKEAGAVAVSDDGNPVEDASMMRKGMEYASDFGLVVISHCEEKSLSWEGDMNEGYLSTTMGLRGIPAIAEEIQVARDVLLSEYTGIPVHIAHISTEGSVRIIREAKTRGVYVTCETCPHYFSLTEDACRGFDTNAKVNPPLREGKDRLAVIKGLADGTIDIIATDHAPHHEDEKKVEFHNAANGISGFETAFSAAYTYLVEPGTIDMAKLVQLMTYGPLRILNKPAAGLKKGEPADIAVVDTDLKYTVDAGKFLSKGKNTPFDGMELKGAIRYTISQGRLAYERSL